MALVNWLIKKSTTATVVLSPSIVPSPPASTKDSERRFVVMETKMLSWINDTARYNFRN